MIDSTLLTPDLLEGGAIELTQMVLEADAEPDHERRSFFALVAGQAAYRQMVRTGDPGQWEVLLSVAYSQLEQARRTLDPETVQYAEACYSLGLVCSAIAQWTRDPGMIARARELVGVASEHQAVLAFDDLDDDEADMGLFEELELPSFETPSWSAFQRGREAVAAAMDVLEATPDLLRSLDGDERQDLAALTTRLTSETVRADDLLGWLHQYYPAAAQRSSSPLLLADTSHVQLGVPVASVEVPGEVSQPAIDPSVSQLRSLGPSELQSQRVVRMVVRALAGADPTRKVEALQALLRRGSRPPSGAMREVTAWIGQETDRRLRDAAEAALAAWRSVLPAQPALGWGMSEQRLTLIVEALPPDANDGDVRRAEIWLTDDLILLLTVHARPGRSTEQQWSIWLPHASDVPANLVSWWIAPPTAGFSSLDSLDAAPTPTWDVELGQVSRDLALAELRPLLARLCEGFQLFAEDIVSTEDDR